MGYDTIIFDLDGTLLNTLDDLADSVNYALAQYGFPACEKNDVRAYLGQGVRWLMSSAMPADAEKTAAEECLGCFKARYQKHLMDKTRPYDGIPELLRLLKERGVRTAIVSNKFDAAVKSLNEKYFSDLLEIAVGESKTVRRKPAPDMVREAMRALGAKPESTLYVGDSEVDAETAANAGIRCAGVTWGFRDRGVLERCGVDYIADTPAELLQVIEKGNA